MQIRLNDRIRSFTPARAAASAATTAQPPSGFTLGQLVGASVVSGLIVWGITTWLEGGTR